FVVAMHKNVGTATVDMCLVATAGADAYYHIGMHCWDIAASALIVKESDGVIIDTDEYSWTMCCRCIIRQENYKGLRQRTNWCLQVDTHTHTSKVCTVPKQFQCTFMTQRRVFNL
uniref:Inositol monophosphatase 1 n=1 Tax=Salmo trutta TaxID=8032 RepID=A0A673Z0X8_SALTR